MRKAFGKAFCIMDQKRGKPNESQTGNMNANCRPKHSKNEKNDKKLQFEKSDDGADAVPSVERDDCAQLPIPAEHLLQICMDGSASPLNHGLNDAGCEDDCSQLQLPISAEHLLQFCANGSASPLDHGLNGVGCEGTVGGLAGRPRGSGASLIFSGAIQKPVDADAADADRRDGRNLIVDWVGGNATTNSDGSSGDSTEEEDVGLEGVTNYELQKRGFSREGVHLAELEEKENEEEEESENEAKVEGNVSVDERELQTRQVTEEEERQGKEEEREEMEENKLEANSWRSARTSDGRILELKKVSGSHVGMNTLSVSDEARRGSEGDVSENETNPSDSAETLRCGISTTATISSLVVSESVYPEAFSDALTRLSELDILLHEAHDLLQAYSPSSVASLLSWDKKTLLESSFRATMKSSLRSSLQRDVKFVKTLTTTRKECRDTIASRITSEVKYMEAEALPEHAQQLDNILRELTANLGSNPARKKAFMARVTRIHQSVRAKRKNDDIQGQAIMKASEIRRLAVLSIENHFFLQEAALMRSQLLLTQLSHLLLKMSSDDRLQLGKDPRVGSHLQKVLLERSLQPDLQRNGSSTIEELQRRFRSTVARFLSTEKNMNASLESGNEEIHLLRCKEGDIFDRFLRKISSKNYGTSKRPSQEKFEENLDLLSHRCRSMLNNESINSEARAAHLLAEMQTHMNTLRLGLFAQNGKLKEATETLRSAVGAFRREITENRGGKTANGDDDDDDDDNDDNDDNDDEADGLNHGRYLQRALRLSSLLKEQADDFPGIPGKTSPWVELISGAIKAPYHSGQADDVDEAITLVFNYPGTQETSNKKFEYKESQWLPNLSHPLK